MGTDAAKKNEIQKDRRNKIVIEFLICFILFTDFTNSLTIYKWKNAKEVKKNKTLDIKQ